MDKLHSAFAGRGDAVIIGAASLAAVYIALSSRRNDPYGAPDLVSSWWPASLISHFRAVFWNDALVNRGYKKYRHGMFRIPMLGSWTTAVGPDFIEEVAKAPESVLSLREVFNQLLQTDHIIGPHISEEQVHLTLIRTLNRNLDDIFPEIADEAEFFISNELEKIKADKDGWKPVTATWFVGDLMTALNLRAFVNLPLCRDPKWKQAINRDMNVMTLNMMVLRPMPVSFRPGLMKLMNSVVDTFGGTRSMVVNLMEERLAMPEDERPHDLLTWILARVPGEKPDPTTVSGVFQMVHNVAHSTTFMSFAHALFHLVAHPECIEPLRAEIEEAVGLGELSKQSLDKMHRLDSFLQETQRVSAIGNFTLNRVAMKDFTFSNGVKIPAGQSVNTMIAPLHHDPEFYPDPSEFKPWRFCAGEQGEDGDKFSRPKNDMTETSPTYMTWGIGRHACPGRWYAAMVMKYLMAYLLINYDIKLPDSAKGKRPADLSFASVCAPNYSATVLFRRRETGPKESQR